MQNYFSRKIKALTADKSSVSEASLFEELGDSETTRIVGGVKISIPDIDDDTLLPTINGFPQLLRIDEIRNLRRSSN